MAGMKGAFTFAKKERINLPQDFRRVMRFGKRIPTKNFIFFLQENKREGHRLGIVVKKEVGSATFRNRIKRYIREFFRLNKHRLKGSFDIIFLVKKGCLSKCYQEVEEELKGFLIR